MEFPRLLDEGVTILKLFMHNTLSHWLSYTSVPFFFFFFLPTFPSLSSSTPIPSFSGSTLLLSQTCLLKIHHSSLGSYSSASIKDIALLATYKFNIV